MQGLVVAPVFSHLGHSGDLGGFQHGVASGDPDATSVVIWTRITTPNASVGVSWEVAADADFRQIVARGEVVTTGYSDHTVKVLVEGLLPGLQYFYRFQTAHDQSIIGRTRTLPVEDLERLGLAIASCSNFAFGYFNAYRAIAEDPDVEYVLHLGDYIYEYGAEGWGADTAKQLDRVHRPANEIVSLADYRERHGQYKADLDSIAMHAAHPLLLVWDDHESANNPWLGGAQNHQPDAEGLWRDRRGASIQAYYEWMPIREPGMFGRREEFWRSYRFGNLATLITLESRHSGRAQQVEYADHWDSIDSIASARRFEADVLNAPERDMLSSAMHDFLTAALAQSKAAGQPWRLLGNAIPMAKMPVPDIAEHGITLPNGDDAGEKGDLLWKGRYQLPFYLDTWDGYPWARERLYQQCQSVGVQDLLVLTGDSHSFWANTLADQDGAPMGIELGTAGISSPGDFVEQGYDRATAGRLDELFAQFIPEVRWTSNLHQGYVRVVLEATQGRADFIGVDTVLTPSSITNVVHTEYFAPAQGSIRYL
jgi:alkaline phosphatase D